jgi:hypothetical protein
MSSRPSLVGIALALGLAPAGKEINEVVVEGIDTIWKGRVAANATLYAYGLSANVGAPLTTADTPR